MPAAQKSNHAGDKSSDIATSRGQRALDSVASHLGPIVTAICGILLVAVLGGLVIYDRKAVIGEMQRTNELIQKQGANVVLLKTAIEIMHEDLRQSKAGDTNKNDPVDIILRQIRAELLRGIPTKAEFSNLATTVAEIRNRRVAADQEFKQLLTLNGDLANKLDTASMRLQTIDTAMKEQQNTLTSTRASLASLTDNLLVTAVSQRLADASSQRFMPDKASVLKKPGDFGTVVWTPLVSTWYVTAKDGAVTIHGTAPDQQTRDRLIEAAAAVPGVTRIDPQIQVERK